MKNLKSYYAIYIPGIVLTMTTTFAILGYLTVAEYAVVNMYMVYSNYMPILTFGFQDGMFLKYRMQPLEDNAKKIKSEFIFMVLFQLIIYIIFILLVLQFDSQFLWYAALGMLPINLISVVRNILQGANKINAIAILDLVMRIGVFLAFVSMFILHLGYVAFIYFDIFYKMVILIIFTIYLLRILRQHTNSDENMNEVKLKDRILNNFKSGFMILIGSWVWIVIYSLDKVFLSTSVDNDTLGAYAAAMALINLFITAIVPIRTIVLSSVDKNISREKVSILSRFLNLVTIIIASGYLLVGYPIITYLNIMPKYAEAFSLIIYIILLLPMILNLQVLLSNVVMVKFHKKFPILNIILLVFTVGMYSLATYLSGNVYGIILASILSFLVMYIGYSLLIGDFKVNLKNFIILIGWMILYVLATFYFIFMILFIIYLVIYMIGELRNIKEYRETFGI